MFLAKKKPGVLTDCRNVGKTRKHTLARKNTTKVPDVLMCGGKKRHAAKEFRKPTLGNENWAVFKKWCENNHSTSRKYFFIEISKGENVKYI